MKPGQMFKTSSTMNDPWGIKIAIAAREAVVELRADKKGWSPPSIRTGELHLTLVAGR